MNPEGTTLGEFTGRLADHPDAQSELSWALEQGQWTRTLDRPDDNHLLMYDQTGAPVAVLKCRPPAFGRCHLLYVLAKTIGRGDGPRLLAEFLDRLSRRHPGCVVECEIQSADPARVERMLRDSGFATVGTGWERTV